MKNYLDTAEITGGLSIILAIEDAPFFFIVNILPSSATTVKNLLIKPADRSHPRGKGTFSCEDVSTSV